jgi:predicted site-specific integrase-resolvase
LLAFTIKEFCDAHRISRSHFYEMEKKGLAPVITNLNGKLIILAEAAATWRRKRLAAGSRPKRPATNRTQAGADSPSPTSR